jgi:hypothetical protein
VGAIKKANDNSPLTIRQFIPDQAGAFSCRFPFFARFGAKNTSDLAEEKLV